MLKSRTTQLVVAGLLLIVFGVVGVLAVALRIQLFRVLGIDVPAAQPSIAAEVFPNPSPEADPKAPLQPAAAPAEKKKPTSAGLQKAISALDTSGLADTEGKPATLAWEMMDVATGQVLASHNASAALIPASNVKTLTAVALFTSFEGTERFATRVVLNSDGMVVLVGGGDPLLTAEPVKTYPAPASLRSLAELAAKSLKEKNITSVRLGYDDSYFAADRWAATWPENYRDQVTPISALWADEGKISNVRQADPALAAAQVFAGQLGELGITVQGDPTTAVGDGAQLAEVLSPSVHAVAEQTLQRSNNSYAEVLGRHLAKKTGRPTTFKGATEAISVALGELGIWDESAKLDDASGLSRSNRISADLLARASLKLASEGRLTNVIDGLPVAGVSGTLHDRFTEDRTLSARGVARAKSGTLSQVASLGGLTTTADGSVIAFGIIANGQVDGWKAKVWIDQVVAVVTGCGC